MIQTMISTHGRKAVLLSAVRGDLALSGARGKIIIHSRGIPHCDEECRRRPELRNHAMEPYPHFRSARQERSESAASSLGTLPDLLAPDIRFRLPARPFSSGRTGSHPGFFCDDAGA